MPKTALVLSGGGFKGAFQVGALEFIRNNWHHIQPGQTEMHFDMVAGVSVGSLNGLLVASNQFDELLKLWMKVAENGVSEIYTSDFLDTRPDQGNPDPKLKLSIDLKTIKQQFPKTTKNLIFRALFKRKKLFRMLGEELASFRSFADNQPLKEKLDLYAKRANIQNTVYKCGYVSLNDGKYYAPSHNEFKTDQDFANGVLASTAMPIVWKPVADIHTNNAIHRQSVDGGIRDVSPLGDVIREIAKQPEEWTIVIINCSSGTLPVADFTEKNIAEIAMRSLVDIAITEIFNNDLEEFIDKNYILEQVHAQHPNFVLHDYDFKNKSQGKPLKFFNSLIIQPDDGELGNTLLANDVLVKNRMNHGRRKAALALQDFSQKEHSHKFTVV